MEIKRSYRRRGTPDLPMATYIGIGEKNMKVSAEAEYHPETEIALMVSGSTSMQIADEILTFHPGDIFLIPANTIHRRTWFSSDALSYRLVFSTKAIQMLPEHFFQREFVQPLSEGRLEMPTVLQPGHPAYATVYDLMLQLERCRIYENNYRQWRLHILMGVCLALMPYCRVKEDSSTIPDPGHEAVKLCMRYIHNNHKDKLTLQMMADHCHLHPNYLCAVFKQYTGQTALAYLTKIRVESAAGLLAQGKLSMDEVAELSGFQSQCQFFKKFKALMGITPKAYARQFRDAK